MSSVFLEVWPVEWVQNSLSIYTFVVLWGYFLNVYLSSSTLDCLNM